MFVQQLQYAKPQKRPRAITREYKIITLPAYSPELNPVEKLWDIVKDGIC
ncbi:MAG TPA: hypothetical protein DDW21_04335, partial [Verrucomicrobiales bacterium]|nr:hypothetical protein [Verrucomicrobiales bacterium]